MKHKYILVRILLLCPLLFNNFLSPSSNDHRVTPVYAAEVKTSAPIVSSLVSESAVKQIPSAENTVTATVSPSSLSTLQSFTSGERTFTRTFLASKDTYIDEENPTTNYGLDPTLWVRMTSSPDHRRTLLYFDVQGLPENAVVLTATLELYNMINRDLSQAPTAITVFPDSIDSDWSETGVTWNTRPSSTNRGDAAEEYVLTGWTRWNVTNIVAGWLGGDYPNYGILLRTGMQGSAYWLTREDTNGPRLTITYTTEGSPMMFPVQKDTWVNEALPSTNYGSEDYLRVRYDGVGMGNRAYTLLWFDTSDLPSDIVVISATLEAYSMINQVQSNQLLFGEDIFPDTIHTDWDEMTVTWNNKPVAYGGGPPSPYQEGWMSWDVTESVEGWVDGTALNYGIQLRIYNVAGALADFVGRPNPFAPRLTVYYEPAPPVCDPMTAVSVSGPTQGNTSTDYAFEASVTPFDATAPFTYTWAATDQTPVVAFTSSPTHTTTFNWASAGSKTVTVTVESCSGSVSDVHTVNITTPPPACTDPLTGMTFSGPPQGLTDAGYSFRSVVAPKTATTPITFTWEADEQSLVVVSGIALQSTQVYTWNTLGPKAITVTAENCGGTFVKYHTMEIVEPWELPDLDVSTAWYDSETQQIGYLVQNIGGSIAPAWHYINLYQGTVEPEQNMPFPHTLQPGAIREATFDTARACATASEPIRICADYFDKVVEGDEGNNCWSLTWPCDMDPPAIISGPTVVTTTENTATIAWETNEPCSSEVKYGKGSVYYPYSEETATLTTDHQVVLTGLDDTSVYHFYVLVTDAGGTSVNSDEAFFETQAAGFDPPIITHLDTVTLTHDFYDLYVIQVSVDDITGLDRIELYYGGDLIKTDYFYPGRGLNTWAYISPHAMGETRATFFFSGHMVTAKAINHNGATTEQSKLHTPSLTPKHVDVDMITPPQNHTLYVDGDPTPAGTTINVMVEAAQFEWGCTWSGYIEGFLSEVAPVFCADVDQAADEIKLLLDGVVVDSYTPAFGEFNHTFSLDLAGEALGTHTVEVVAHASDGNTDSEQRTFTIARGTPSLSLQRTVSRVANYFEVQLTLSNAANATLDAEVSRIFDYMHGFQVISKQTGQGLQAVTAGTYTIRPFSYFAGDFSIKIEFFDGGNDFITLAPGESFVVNYVVVPVMFESATNYTMGDTGTLVHHKDGPDTLYATSGNLNSAVASAFNEADYLIVTNPSQLVVHYGTGDDLNALYSEMARLAQLKRGALGYLNSTNKYVLDDLVEPNQPWAAAMYPDFSSIRKGYMLIVGEVEIVSAWSYTGLDLNWADSDVDDAHYSDHAYANTKGDGAPDLIVGRVIGDSPTALRDAIRTGINVDFGAWEFDRSHALLVSGRGGSVNRFRDNVNDLESDLTSEGWAVTKIHWRDYRFLSTYWHGFREYDGFAAGDVIAGGKAEVAIARRAGDYIHLKDADGNTVGGFDRSFDEGDVIAVGDVGWDSAAEVIIGDRSDGTIYIYDFDGGAALGSISCGFASFDGLATGYVKAGTKAQIIFGDASADTITVYDQTGASLMSFSAPFDTHDGLAAGNVMTGTNETTRDEILVGHDDTIYVYDDDDGGLVSSFSVDHNFIAGDRLAAGNIHAESGIAFDEIVIGDRDDVVYMYNKDGTLLNSVNVVEFEYYDGLAVADVTGGYEEEIIMADRDDYIHLVDAYYPHHALSTFKANTAGQDVIYFSGHGNTNVWGPALHTWDFPLNFNNTKPFVFAPSCLTGNYEGSNDNSIAEAFFESEAAVYIGATEVSPIRKNISAGEWFFDHWDDGESIGSAFTQLERAGWDWDDDGTDMWEFWVYEYNVYGDPKLGADGSVLPTTNQLQLTAPQAPAATRDITIPDFEVTDFDGYHHADIPGGHLILTQGEYRIPYWIESVDYHPGTVVQDVSLVSRSGLTVTTGLTIPIVNVTHECATCAPQDTAAPTAAGDTWVPVLEDDIRWYVTEGPDGSTRLNIAVYPFFYNPANHAVRFYQDYTVDIQTSSTDLSIQALDTDQNTYDLNAPVSITLVISNAGSVQDVIVEAVVKAYPDQAVSELPLRNLHDLTGLAVATLVWDSTGVAAGDYFVEVNLRNSDGDVLAGDAEEFTLGGMSDAITKFTATPSAFVPGDTVATAMTVNNTGAARLYGTAIVKVLPQGIVTPTATFTHTLNGLTPGADVILSDAWDTTGITGTTYRILGYVKYDSMVSEAKQVTVSTQAYIYLPLVLRRYP